MDRVGAYEAKTHLPQLLERVAKGERFTITKHGVPVAVLQTPEGVRDEPVLEVIRQLKAFRAGRGVGALTIRELIDEGRR